MGAEKNRTTGENRSSGGSGEKASATANLYLFACVGGIMWVVPAISILSFGIVNSGFGIGFGAAIAVILLGIPNSLFAMNAFSKRRHPGIIAALCVALLALHAVCAFLLDPRVWYLPLLPAALFLILLVCVSGAARNH